MDSHWGVGLLCDTCTDTCATAELKGIRFSEDEGTFPFSLCGHFKRLAESHSRKWTKWIDLIIFGWVWINCILSPRQNGVVWPWGQTGVIIWGRRSTPFAQAWRGSDFNAPLWAVLTANNINSSRRTHTHTYTQTCCICARINTLRHKGNPSHGRVGGKKSQWDERTHIPYYYKCISPSYWKESLNKKILWQSNGPRSDLCLC